MKYGGPASGWVKVSSNTEAITGTAYKIGVHAYYNTVTRMMVEYKSIVDVGKSVFLPGK
jgi:hypothetical protein